MKRISALLVVVAVLMALVVLPGFGQATQGKAKAGGAAKTETMEKKADTKAGDKKMDAKKDDKKMDAKKDDKKAPAKKPAAKKK